MKAFLFFLLITAAFGGLQSFSVPVLGGIYGLTAAAGVLPGRATTWSRQS